jgi:hypothetical protein
MNGYGHLAVMHQDQCPLILCLVSTTSDSFSRRYTYRNRLCRVLPPAWGVLIIKYLSGHVHKMITLLKPQFP